MIKKLLLTFILIFNNALLSSLSISSINQQIEVLDKEKKELSKVKDHATNIAKLVEAQQILQQKLTTATGKDHSFLTKQLSLITQSHQIVSELEQIQAQYVGLIDEHIKLLAEYKDDPTLEKSLNTPSKAFYTFDEFEQLGHQLLQVKTKLADVEKSKVSLYDDLTKRKKAKTALDEEIKQKTKEQEEFALQNNDFSAVDKGRLINLQKQLMDKKQQLALLRIKEAEQHLSLLDTQIIILRATLTVLQEHYDRIKQLLVVDSIYLQKAEADLEKKRNELSYEREQLRAKIKALSEIDLSLKQKENTVLAAAKLSSTDAAAIKEWNTTPHSTKDWNAICELGTLTLERNVINLEKNVNEALIERDNAKLYQEEMHYLTIKSWHTLTRRRLGFSSTALEEQIKSFEAPKAEVQSSLALMTEKRAQALSLLQELNTLFERFRQISSLYQSSQKNGKTGDAIEIKKVCGQKLEQAEENIRKSLYLKAKLIEIYSSAIALLEAANKRIENVITELKTKTFWRRSEFSISFAELKNFFPDIKKFLFDIKVGLSSYSKSLSWERSKKWFSLKFGKPLVILLFLLRILILLLLFFALKMYLPDLQYYFAKKPEFYGQSSIKSFIAVLLEFINRHLTGLYLWTVLYILVSSEYITNVYFSLLFYALSIPYMLIMAYLFIRHIILSNAQLNYRFISRDYSSRFLIIVPTLLYVTVVLFFIRKAFLLGNYHASAVPSILISINYILFQLSLMGLVTKEWILSLISRKNALSAWFYDLVNEYYYIFWTLIMALIIMSNPYVGYGRQVIYVLSRILIIAVLVPLLSYVYTYLRQAMSNFFFSSEGEIQKERFNAARTWYGFFLVLSFFIFILAGLLLVLGLLGYRVNFGDITSWINYELYSPGIDEMGRRVSVTPFSFLKFFMVFLGGLICAYIVNKLLLKKIFDPLLISSGVQNTIFTFTRYFIIFLALLIGLRSLALESFATKLVLILGAISFALKDPLLDFFSYFIILVQRPIKIGDVIMLDENTRGVVRHITPRSVILRRDNSVTLIVPNSHIITRSVINWTFTPTFIGLNDIRIIFPYDIDPQKIRSTIFKVLDSNPHILKTPTPIIRLESFAEHGFEFLIRGYITADKVLEQWDIASNLRMELFKTFYESKIEIAAPVRIIRAHQTTTDQIIEKKE